jgi:hypothetical protein
MQVLWKVHQFIQVLMKYEPNVLLTMLFAKFSWCIQILSLNLNLPTLLSVMCTSLFISDFD